MLSKEPSARTIKNEKKFKIILLRKQYQLLPAQFEMRLKALISFRLRSFLQAK